MAGLSLADLPWPDDGWRVDLHSERFETPEEAAAEDAKRARMLRKMAKSRKGKRQKRLVELAHLLDPKVTAEPPKSLASARYMRDLRIRITGEIWRLVAEDQTGKVVRFDVIKPKWAHDRKGLRKERAQRLRAEFRADLLRAAENVIPGGASNCDGFLFAVLHGEHESESGLFQLHFHLVATGDWVAVVDELRDVKGYKATERVSRPIRARRKLKDHPHALSYLVKSYWPGKWWGEVGGQAGKRRRRQHWRIPEPHHSDVLLWLHRWKVGDLALLMKLQVRKLGMAVIPYTNRDRKRT